MVYCFTVLECQSTDWANPDAFTAFLALRLAKRVTTKGSNHSLEAAVGETKNANAQLIPAYPHTSPTENALIRVIDK